MTTRIRRLAVAMLAAAGAAAPAWATNGYFPHGYGMKALGMGGTAVALAHDTIAGASNPAAMVTVGGRADVGLVLFMPRRDAERSGAGFPTLNGSIDSGNTRFWVPEAGFNRMFGNDLALGVTVYGNGGMNTTYPQGNFNCGAGPANMLCGGGSLGVDLAQLIVAPTLAYRLNPQHAVGVSLLLGWQQFKAHGVQAFDNAPGFPPFTGAPGRVTNNGYDSATGVGLRLGWQGRIGDTVTLGAAYAPKMNMGRFDKYAGLFAGSGDFDIPSHWALGVAFVPAPGWTVALEAGRINYSDVAAVSNPSAARSPMGAADGPGFGWQDIDIFKLGVAWRLSDAWTLRAGYNRGDNPVGPADVTFNILAPGIMKEHYSAGFTVALDKNSEITGALMVAPRQSVTGSSLFNAVLGPGAGGNETIRMRQTLFGVSWGYRY